MTETYAIEQDSDGAVRVKGGLVAAELSDSADEEDVAVDEVVEVGRGDARGGELLGHCGADDEVGFVRFRRERWRRVGIRSINWSFEDKGVSVEKARQ